MNGTFSPKDMISYLWVTLSNLCNVVPPVSVPLASDIDVTYVPRFISYEGSELEAT